VETKDDLMAEICDLLAIETYKTTIGSSVPRRFFSDLLDYFGLPDDGDAVTACKTLITNANLKWEREYSSEASPSGGGGTVTLSGLKALRNSIAILLDEDEANSLNNLAVDPTKEDEWTLLRGQSILRKKLHVTYGGIQQGGISPSNSTKNVFIFSDDAANKEHGYERDYWVDDLTFIYCGDGQKGNQALNNRNGTIFNHITQGRKLRLFSPVRGLVTYLGELIIDSENPYTLKDGLGRDGLPRTVVMFKLKRVLEKHESMLNSEVDDAGLDFGAKYKYADENSRNIENSEPFNSDPNLLDRALQLHSITQNTVANWIQGEGLVPISPNSKTCDFDIAWESEHGRVVCEVKSLSDTNEVHQFRLGLGQVLEYAYLTSAIPVLMFSRMPNNLGLLETAQNSGVKVLWPEVLNKYTPDDLRNIRAK
jgi:hypothetical protein